MPRWADNTARQKQVELTQKLASAILLACSSRNISIPEIEEALCVGTADDRSGKKTGKQFRRWLTGKNPMTSDVRQRVTAKAIKLRWIESYEYDPDAGVSVLNDIVKAAPPKEILDGQALSDRINALVAERQKWQNIRSALLKALNDFSSFQPKYGYPSGLVAHYMKVCDGGTAWDFADADKEKLTKEIQSVTAMLTLLDEYEWNGLSAALGWQLPKLSNKPKKASSGANLVQSKGQIKSKLVKSSQKKSKSKQ